MSCKKKQNFLSFLFIKKKKWAQQHAAMTVSHMCVLSISGFVGVVVVVVFSRRFFVHANPSGCSVHRSTSQPQNVRRNDLLQRCRHPSGQRGVELLARTVAPRRNRLAGYGARRFHGGDFCPV
jgi:hypothetical protein